MKTIDGLFGNGSSTEAPRPHAAAALCPSSCWLSRTVPCAPSPHRAAPQSIVPSQNNKTRSRLVPRTLAAAGTELPTGRNQTSYRYPKKRKEERKGIDTRGAAATKSLPKQKSLPPRVVAESFRLATCRARRPCSGVSMAREGLPMPWRARGVRARGRDSLRA
jgi:hypothetical protein